MRSSAISALAALALAGCKTVHTADFIATPPDRLVCEAAGPRPKIPPEYAIDWAKVTTVAEARGEVAKLLASVHDREGVVVADVLRLEGKLFVCSSNMQWRRDWEAELARTHREVDP